MKKITIKNCIMLALLTIIAPIMALSSCSKDDDGGDASIKKGRRLLMVVCEAPDPDDSYHLKYEYDDKGRLCSIRTSTAGDCRFIYSEPTVYWIYGEKEHEALITDSHIQYVFPPRDQKFTYDNKGRLQKWSSNYFISGREVHFVWDDENIDKLLFSDIEVSIKYTKIKAHDLAYLDEFNPLFAIGYTLNYYKWHDHFIFRTGLCGAFSKYLPSEIVATYEDSTDDVKTRSSRLKLSRTFEYTTDSSGYPVRAVMKELGGLIGGEIHLTFIWE